ncbi:class I SAM-dependent methyltransferase [Shimia abyssi]|uniref:Methyltransferase family protein n=1 Tax=Shimia abyssi TaxID=1662395 RepID=A0A2P8FG58_9RHOB|nr:class I SAM-dependent methyltransferase [Shimia abyssi]PSL20696.1 methyltransferase family protein [Shimia abyssi]
MDWDAFFAVHKDLPREGPGSDRDVAWALALAELPEGASICDAGSGPGGDVAALLRAPDARVLAVDKFESFVAQAAARYRDTPRVQAVVGDMGALEQLNSAPFDLIWCAGALYFYGIEEGLQRFSKALKPKGVVAFSEPCFFVDAPSERAVAFWDGYEAGSVDAVLSRVAAQGFEVLGHRAVSDAGWEAYFQPMEARIAGLRDVADARLREMLDICAEEAMHWREVRKETGYVLVVARKCEATS